MPKFLTFSNVVSFIALVSTLLINGDKLVGEAKEFLIWLSNSPQLEGKWTNSLEGFVDGGPECLKKQKYFIEMNIYSARDSRISGDMTSDLLRKKLAKGMAIAIPELAGNIADALPNYVVKIPTESEARAMAEKAPQTQHTLLGGKLSWFSNSVKKAKLFDIIEGKPETYGHFSIISDSDNFVQLKSLDNTQEWFPKEFCLFKATEEEDTKK